MMKKIRLFTIFSIFLITSSCGKMMFGEKSNTVGTDQFNTGPGLRSCTCITVFSPVCGANGTSYSNSCLAECAGTTVQKQGECCDSQSGQVCGQPEMPQLPPCEQGQACPQYSPPAPQFYANECTLEQVNATPLPASNCN